MTDYDDEVHPEEDTRHATDLRNEALDLIKKFENKLLSAAVSESEEDGTLHPVPEFLDEERESLRDDLYDSLRHLFLESKASEGAFSISFFEHTVYTHVSERIRRTLGFYQALQRSQEEVRLNNQELGDPYALELNLPATQKLLSSLDEITFIRQLGTSLGLAQDDLDKVLDNVISREFAPLHRRSVPVQEPARAQGRTRLSDTTDE